MDGRVLYGREKNTEGEAESAHPSEVLITGAAGRLGRMLSSMLVSSGARVRALVSKKERMIDLPTGVVPFVGDINDAEALKKACEGVEIVYHLAAIVSQYKSTTRELMRVNANGAKSIADAASATDVKRIIFTSSVDVYGRERKGPLDEESELRPTDMYGYSKLIAEQNISSGNTPYTILRLATIYGEGFESSFFKVFKALRAGRIYIIGTGKNHMPLLNVNDLLSSMVLAASNRASAGKVYNITDGESHTQEELLNLAADWLGVPRPQKHINPMLVKIFAKRRGLDSDELRFLTSDRIINISKAKRELGYEPKIGIKEGGKELVKKFISAKK